MVTAKILCIKPSLKRILHDGTIDWRHGLQSIALELQQYSTLPVRCNPTSITIEQYIGDGNTYPTDDGIVITMLEDNGDPNFSFLPSVPLTYTILEEAPENVGKFI